MDFPKLIDWAEKKSGIKLPRWVYLVIAVIAVFGLIASVLVTVLPLVKTSPIAPSVTVTGSPGSIVAPSGGNNSVKNYFDNAADRRPWVSVTPTIEGIEWGPNGARLNLRFLMQNTGRSPAEHVAMQDAALPFMTVDPKNIPYNWIVRRLEASKRSPMGLGPPIYPGVPVLMNSTELFSVEEIQKFKHLISTAKRNSNDPPPQPIPDAQLSIPIAVAYVVDYDDGKTKYQSYCWASVNWVDPARPSIRGLALPFNKNLLKSELALFEENFGCGAE